MNISRRWHGCLISIATWSITACSSSEEPREYAPNGSAEGSQLRSGAVGDELANGRGHCARPSGAGGGGGAGGACGDFPAVVGALDGRLMQFPCADTSSPIDDCNALGYVVDGVVHACSEGKSELVLDHPISGPPGARYRLALHFYGIMEPKSYGPSVVREAAPGAPDRNGGMPTSWATAPAGSSVPTDSYNSYELLVYDAGGLEKARHYLNASPDEGHWTLLIDYQQSIEVEAGGFVRLRSYDNNCRLMKNCGATGGPPCAPKARTVDLSSAEPPPPVGSFPAGLHQPGLNLNPNDAGQWWMVDVTAVTPL